MDAKGAKNANQALPFPLALRAALKSAKMSQAELARRVGCGRASISGYVRGENAPSRERLRLINEALGANIEPPRLPGVKDVAAALGVSTALLRRGIKEGAGWLGEIAAVVPSKNGKRHTFVFSPTGVKRLVGIG
jgi:transcriptional regulator with XRE-family HTH domain